MTLEEMLADAVVGALNNLHERMMGEERRQLEAELVRLAAHEDPRAAAVAKEIQTVDARRALGLFQVAHVDKFGKGIVRAVPR